MRCLTYVFVASAAVLAYAAPAAAKPTAQSASCAAAAKQQGLSGAQRSEFIGKCLKGPLAPTKPTATVPANPESQAVTKPSGVDRTTRSKQCDAEANRKHLAGQPRKAFQLSCLATAGPVSEGETATVEPLPAKQIKGIGVNNYKNATGAASSHPDPSPPAAASPKP